MIRLPAIQALARSRYLLPAVLAVVICVSAAFSLLPARHTSASGRVVSPPWPYARNAELWPALDRLIERVPLDSQGRLLLDGRTAAAIQPFSQAAIHSLHPAERQRVHFLIQRGLPFAAEQVSRLSFAYLQYVEDLAQLSDVWDISARRRLQRAHFGDDAEVLFGEENAVIQAMRTGALSTDAD